MPEAELGGHLQGFVGYVRAHGAPEALVMRLLQTLSVLGVVVEPGFDDEGRAMRFVGGLLAAADGLLFLDGEVIDPEGRALLLDDGGGLQPPQPRRVADRAMVLVALAVRGLLEEDAGKPAEARAEELRRCVVGQLDELLGGRPECESGERALLETPVGRAPKQTAVDALWRAEAVPVLLWALGARELPDHDAEEHACALAEEAGLRGGATPDWFDAPKLRPAEELDAARRALTAVHWRLREQRLRPGPVDFVGFAANNWFGGASLQGIPLAGRDLAVAGRPVFEADDELLSPVASRVCERHRAANWLVGVHRTWSRVATPT
jgi:hypothetical protein